MQRALEPELMEDKRQAAAYAEADFEQPHSEFVERIKTSVSCDFAGMALDLGCGPGDISRRFASAYPLCRIDAVDGSSAMLDHADRMTDSALADRLRFIQGLLPEARLPHERYDLIFSNSLLHHLPDPQILWQSVKQYGKWGAQVFIMDLLRPESREEAGDLVSRYATSEPEILQRDFFNSLLAAFTIDEINQQIEQAGLRFFVQQISDRHVFISGIII